MDLTEAEDIKRWQEYTEELYKKDLHDPDNYNCVITHLEPDILEWEVKWALGIITTNKSSGGHGISVELFQILIDDAVKVLYSICQQIWKTQQWPQDWKRSVFIPILKKGNAKESSKYCTIALISVPFSSVAQSCLTLCDPVDCSMTGLLFHHQFLKFIHTHVHWVSDAIQPSHPLSSPSPSAFLSQHQGLFKWVSSLHQVAKILEFSFSISPSNEYSGLISFRMDLLDLLAVQEILKSLLQDHSSKASILQCSAFHIVQLSHPYMQVKKQQLELDMEQQTGSKSGKGYVKAIYCHPAYLTYMQGTSCKMQVWMKQKLESRSPGEISVTSDMHMTRPLRQKAKN